MLRRGPAVRSGSRLGPLNRTSATELIVSSGCWNGEEGPANSLWHVDEVRSVSPPTPKAACTAVPDEALRCVVCAPECRFGALPTFAAVSACDIAVVGIPSGAQDHRPSRRNEARYARAGHLRCARPGLGVSEVRQQVGPQGPHGSHVHELEHRKRLFLSRMRAALPDASGAGSVSRHVVPLREEHDRVGREAFVLQRVNTRDGLALRKVHDRERSVVHPR